MGAGFGNAPGFLTRYRGVCYHLREFEECPPMNCQDFFNLRHSSLRTTIEQVFGVVKNCFPILRMPHGYSLTTQRDIVIACCTLHKHIVMHSVEIQCLKLSPPGQILELIIP